MGPGVVRDLRVRAFVSWEGHQCFAYSIRLFRGGRRAGQEFSKRVYRYRLSDKAAWVL